MFEKAQAEYSDLVSKKETVQRDKAKIEAVIAECGVKKIEALQATWAKVRLRGRGRAWRGGRSGAWREGAVGRLNWGESLGGEGVAWRGRVA